MTLTPYIKDSVIYTFFLGVLIFIQLFVFNIPSIYRTTIFEGLALVSLIILLLSLTTFKTLTTQSFSKALKHNITVAITSFLLLSVMQYVYNLLVLVSNSSEITYSTFLSNPSYYGFMLLYMAVVAIYAVGVAFFSAVINQTVVTLSRRALSAKQ